jgi:hypothetical protein
MAKYEPLGRYLGFLSMRYIVLTFSEIQEIVSAPLPASAVKYPEWWANETNPATTHTQCKAWLA